MREHPRANQTAHNGRIDCANSITARIFLDLPPTTRHNSFAQMQW